VAAWVLRSVRIYVANKVDRRFFKTGTLIREMFQHLKQRASLWRALFAESTSARALAATLSSTRGEVLSFIFRRSRDFLAHSQVQYSLGK